MPKEKSWRNVTLSTEMNVTMKGVFLALHLVAVEWKTFNKRRMAGWKINLQPSFHLSWKKESISNLEKGVFKEHLSAFLSTQWKGKISSRWKGWIKIQLSASLSEGLEEIHSLFLKAGRKGRLSFTPWGAPQGVPAGVAWGGPWGRRRRRPQRKRPCVSLDDEPGRWFSRGWGGS